MSKQNHKTVLIVNDSADQREMMEFIFQQAGYDTLTAADGHEGFQTARNNQPDLIISDVLMPDGDGIELCQRVRADEKLRTLPILLVSAIRRDVNNIIEGLEVGADDYIELPVDPLHLVARAERLIERKRAEDLLRESENRFRSVIENVSDIISIIFPDGTILYQSPSLEQVLGYKPEQVVGKNIFDLVHEDDKPEVISFFKNKMTVSETTPPIEYRFRDSRGNWLMFESVGKFINDSSKGLVAVINSRDVTGRKQAEEKLREREEWMRAILSASRDGIVIEDNAEIAYINKSYAQLLGYEEPEELVGRHISELLPPEEAERLTEFGRRRLRGEDVTSVYEFKGKHKDGSLVEVEGAVSTCVIGGKKYIMTAIRDITERKNAEKVLRQAEQKYESLFANAITGIYQTTLDGRYTAANSMLARMFGYDSPEEMIKEVAGEQNLERQFYVEEGRREEFARLIREHGVVTAFESEIYARDGRRIWISEHALAIRNEFDQVTGYQGTTIDITERKRTEAALEQSERDYRTVFEQAHDAIMVFAPEHEVVLDVNQRACKIYGFSRAEFIGMSLERLSKNPANGKKWVKETLEAGESLDFETVQYRNDGSEMFLEVNASTIIYQGQQAIITINRDITGRKEAETAIVEANERAIREYDRLLKRLNTLAQTVGTARDLTAIFRAILDFASASFPCAGLFISLYDQENSNRKIIYLWYNGKEEDVSKFESVLVGEGCVGQAIKTGEIVVVNDYLELLKSRGVRLHIGFDEDPREPRSTLVAPMKIKGNAIGTIEVQSYELNAYQAEHVTAMGMVANLAATAIENVRLLEQEREREEQLRQSQKLESVGRLAGGIAHDFNNMLTAINGYSELTLRRLKADDPLRENVEEIKKAGERSAALTHQLLAFSRQQVLQSKVLDLNEIIFDTTTMLQRLIGEDIQLNTVLNSELGRVEADPGQLTQVLMNLVVNARDAMPEGGALTIETTNVSIDEDYAAQHVPIVPGSYVLLAITDTGIGIDEETRQHIFEPFYTTKEVGKGTGLGLATVYGIVKQSGGYIWVESKIGDGSTFEIYLPRIDEEVQAESTDDSPEYMPNGAETILIVEDEDLVRALTRQVLEECGYEIIEARNGVEALSIFEQPDCKIDLLLTDVVMPQMGGRELAEKVTQARPDLRVLFTSGYTDDAVIRQDVIEPDTNFIQKPFTFDALAHKVRESLDSKN